MGKLKKTALVAGITVLLMGAAAGLLMPCLIQGQ